jgi:hypothetical protein
MLPSVNSRPTDVKQFRQSEHKKLPGADGHWAVFGAI